VTARGIKAAARYGWRVVVMALLLTSISILSFELRGWFLQLPRTEVSKEFFLTWLLGSKLLVVAALTYPVLRSRWSGTQLMVAIFVAYFGIATFISQNLAALAIPEHVTPSMAALLTAHGFLVALLLAALLVVIMGRLHSGTVTVESGRLHMPAREWLYKLALCVVCWLGLHFALCGVADSVLLYERMIIQAFRAVFLVVFALPVIKMMSGGRLETACTVAVLFMVLGAIAPRVSMRLLLQEGRWVSSAVGPTLASGMYGLLVGYLFSRRGELPHTA